MNLFDAEAMHPEAEQPVADKHDDIMDLVRLSQGERHDLLNELDEQSEEKAADQDESSDRRTTTRWTFRSRGVTLIVVHPGGSESRFVVCPRNLSAGGIGFLHGGYLHPGTTVNATLTRLDGVEVHVSGTIVNCRHIRGSLHEFGVAFEERIEPCRYLREAGGQESASDDAVDPTTLYGHVLYIDDSKMDRKLMAFHLKSTNISIDTVATIQEALDKLAEVDIDFVMTDLNLADGESGIEAAVNLRCTSFAGPIVLITSDTDQQQILAARDAGVTHVIAKPIVTDELLRALADVSRSLGLVRHWEVTHSRFEEDSKLRPLIEEFITQMTGCAQQLETALGENAVAEAKQLCMSIKGTGPGLGFDTLGEAAIATLEAVEGCRSLEDAREEIHHLISLCRGVSVRATS